MFCIVQDDSAARFFSRWTPNPGKADVKPRFASHEVAFYDSEEQAQTEAAELQRRGHKVRVVPVTIGE